MYRQEILVLGIAVSRYHHPRPSKLLMKESDKIAEIPFLGDPFIYLDIPLSWEESQNYKLELFQFYKNVAEKVKWKNRPIFPF